MFFEMNHKCLANRGEYELHFDVYTLANTQSQNWEDGNKGRKEEG